MIDKIIKLLSMIQLINKKRIRDKKYVGISGKPIIDYKEEYYKLLEHIYKNKIYLFDRFVYLSPSAAMWATKNSESLRVAYYEDSELQNNQNKEE